MALIPQSYQRNGAFFYYTDGTGPYAIDSTGAAQLVGSGGGSGASGGPSIANLLVQDSTNAQGIRREVDTGGTITVVYENFDTSAWTPVPPIVAVSIPPNTGVATAALQTSQSVLLGPVTETAPTTDTASSGLNGRLQRLAQRLTSLIAQLPASLGIKTSALSMSVAPASDGVFMVAGAAATKTDQSGTITTGGTQQTAIASNASRKGFEIQNQSTGNLYFSTLASAVQSEPSILLGPGQLYETPLGGSGTGAVSIIGATTGQAFAAREWT